MVEGNGLENRRGFRVTQGSNPCLSAINFQKVLKIFLHSNYKERWQSGWMRTPAKGVYRYTVPRVRIPLFPPLNLKRDIYLGL